MFKRYFQVELTDKITDSRLSVLGISIPVSCLTVPVTLPKFIPISSGPAVWSIHHDLVTDKPGIGVEYGQAVTTGW